MKTPKTYRFSPGTIQRLADLKAEFAALGNTWNETDIVEYAISELYSRFREDILNRKYAEHGPAIYDEPWY